MDLPSLTPKERPSLRLIFDSFTLCKNWKKDQSEPSTFNSYLIPIPRPFHSCSQEKKRFSLRPVIDHLDTNTEGGGEGGTGRSRRGTGEEEKGNREEEKGNREEEKGNREEEKGNREEEKGKQPLYTVKTRDGQQMRGLQSHEIPQCSAPQRPSTPPGGWFAGRSEQPARLRRGKNELDALPGWAPGVVASSHSIIAA